MNAFRIPPNPPPKMNYNKENRQRALDELSDALTYSLFSHDPDDVNYTARLIALFLFGKRFYAVMTDELMKG